MKELDVFRYLKKYRAVIAGVSILAGVVFFWAAQFRVQQYTAATVIEYTGSRAAEGLSPDGSAIDPSEIYSTNLVAQAMKSLDIAYSEATIDDIRMGIQVEPVITEEDLQVRESKLNNGEEDYELNPTQYVVSFSCGVGNGKDYPRKVLNQLLQEYGSYYGKTHVNTALAANPVSDLTGKGYDYLEMAEVMDDTLTNLTEDLTNKAGWNGEFRSSRTGRCFQDLVDEFAFIRDVEVRQLFSEILAGRITRDRDVLLDKYRNRNQIKRLNELAGQRGQTLAQMALSWVLKDDEVCSVLIGASKPEQILENISAAYRADFTQEELRAIEEICGSISA